MKYGLVLTLVIVAVTCSTFQQLDVETDPIRYLALGDSYTIGASVDESDRWPEQLSALWRRKHGFTVEVDYRATTGWTTGDLLASLDFSPVEKTYDAVSLLIGVNNQCQGMDFAVYERDVGKLINKGIQFAGGDKNRFFVVSVPDYAYTPFGMRSGTEGRRKITQEIDRYNAWMSEYCRENDIQFVNITPITRRGLSNPALVAKDTLHPSDLAYKGFAETIHKQVSLPFFKKDW